MSYPGNVKLYHERFLGCWVHKEVWIIITPDLDMYAEKLTTVGNRSVADVKFRPSTGATPLGMIEGAQLYAFSASPTIDTRRRWVVEARIMAGTERARLRLPAVTIADLPPVVAELSGPIPGRLPVDDEGTPIDGAPIAAAGGPLVELPVAESASAGGAGTIAVAEPGVGGDGLAQLREALEP